MKPPKNRDRSTNSRFKPALALAAAASAGFGCGVLFARESGWIRAPDHSLAIERRARSDSQLRFVQPLLLCNVDIDTPTGALADLEPALNDLIAAEVSAGHASSVSVYLRDFSSNGALSINPGELYDPASLNKIPAMLTAFEMTERDPHFLNREIVVPAADANGDVEIKPRDFVVPGSRVTVGEAVRKMIVFSDNNALRALEPVLDVQLFTRIHNDLKIPVRTNGTVHSDYMSAKDLAFFFRLLRNGTYLGWDNSEAALKLLSDVEFKNGIVAGLPSSPAVSVAHKFGIFAARGTELTMRQLHDCGIVYAPAKSYLLCVLTKSTASLRDQEAVIEKISRTIYSGLAGS